MKKGIKIAVSILSAVLILFLSVVLGGFIRIRIMESKLHPVTEPFSSMEKVPMCIDRIFPLHETEKCMGFSDYAFIGTVEEILGTEYDSLRYYRFQLTEDTPATYYKVKAHHNIKGTVPEEFTLWSAGGQQPNGMLEEYHPMPENEGTYLFMCCDFEGKISLFNCYYLGGKDWYEKAENVTEIIEKYETCYKNQDLSVRLD